MSFTFLFGLSVVFFSFARTDEEYNCVHTTSVTSENMASMLSSHKGALLLFFAPWCAHCKRLMPDFDKVCGDIKTQSSEVLCAKIDCTTNDELCKEHELKGFPTIKAFNNGQYCEYQGPRVGDRIHSWFKTVLSSGEVISSLEQLQKVIADNKQVVVSFLSKDSNFSDISSSISCKLDSAAIANVRDAEIAKGVGIEKADTFTVFKDGKLFKQLPQVESSDELLRHVFFTVTDLLPDYSHESAPSIFNPQVTFYMAFVYDVKEVLLEKAEPFLTFAEARQPLLRVFTLNSGDPATKDVVNFFHLKKIPAVVFYNDQTGKFNHFDGDEFTVEALEKFANGCIDGSIPPYVKQQPVPENWDSESVKVLVVGNFPDVFTKYSAGLVVFYAPWCGHCEALLPIWKEFGDWVSATHPTFFIGKVDHTENEIDGVEIQGYPTIFAFTSPTEKTTYSGGRTLDDLKKFFVDTFIEKKVAAEPEKETPAEREHSEL